MNHCNICGSLSAEIFKSQVLGKYLVSYYQCERCQFIQTEKPYWLPEAYASAMTALDVGLVYRNIEFSKTIPRILELFSGTNDDSYLDYGGGHGMFVRLMRDLGYDYYLQDLYAENLYAKYFELENYNKEKKFTCLTAFEVFEHLEHPLIELESMFGYSDTIIFSTELQPAITFKHESDWWYFVPEVGQHISFYSAKTLKALAENFKCKLYSNGHNLHILTKVEEDLDPFSHTVVPKDSILRRVLQRLLPQPVKSQTIRNRTSLLMKDFELYKKNLQEVLK